MNLFSFFTSFFFSQFYLNKKMKNVSKCLLVCSSLFLYGWWNAKLLDRGRRLPWVN
jgi:hypothetical protein